MGFSAIIGSAAFFGAVEWKTGRRDDPEEKCSGCSG